jgi:hypothetical protein
MNYKKYLKNEEKSKYSKGDIVSFHNDLGKIVQGMISVVKGDLYTITVHGVKFKRKEKDIYISDRLHEYYSSIRMGYVGSSLTDPASNISGASLKGEISDIQKKVAVVVDKIKSGDLIDAAKLAVSGVFRYGTSYKEKLDSEVGSNSAFDTEYKKAYNDYKLNKKDKPKDKKE